VCPFLAVVNEGDDIAQVFISVAGIFFQAFDLALRLADFFIHFNEVLEGEAIVFLECLGRGATLAGAADNLAILERIASDTVRVYFDTANAVFLGYDVVQEALDLGSRIVQVHIKDHPETPVLGKGEIDFRRVAQAFHQVGFGDYLVLELPTSDDSVTQANLSYIKRMVEKGR